MENQRESKSDIALRVIASSLNTTAQNIDVRKTFDENGGDSIVLLSVIKELKKFHFASSIELFEPHNTLLDALNYLVGINKTYKKSEGNNLKVSSFADLHQQEKEKLLDMCCRSFSEKNILFSTYGVSVQDILPYIRSLADEDVKHPLSLAVYDAASKKYVGGAFLHNYAAEDFVFAEKMYPMRDVLTFLETPHELKEEKKDVLYVAMCYAETDLPSTIHLETFHLLAREINDIAKKNNYRAIVSVAAHIVTQV